ncbi:MAG: PAS domain-containing protein [Endomicrobium sp.]|jgi:PAS domain-containing protein|nr:PAS domain-containing protein [Endomicrobium sp.]
MPVGIEATVAGFRNLPTSVPVKNSVVIFWESHTKNPEDKSKVQSTIDLIPKKFDLSTCENYEVRTGYLSRYNYLSKPKENSQIEELEDAIVKGEEEQLEWIKRCNPNLEGFTQINWQECVSKLKNPKFRDCKDLLMKTIVEDVAIKKAYKESARVYAAKRKTNEQNGFSYLVEENAWILSLPYLYSNKYIYVIHVGNVTEATTLLWSSFEYLRESVRLLFPYFSKQKFSNLADFRSEYENKRNLGYFIDDECFKNVINCKYVKKEDLSKESLLKLLVDERSEKEILTNIIAIMPGHVYWLNKRYYFMGCNNVQARDLGLNSRHEIIGKTIFDLLPKAEAKKHNNINKLVIEKSKVWSGEEKASMYNGFRTYMSHKLPLTNSAGKNVGLLGISVDISDTKKKEELRLKLKAQKELYSLAQQVAHDIASPVTSLKMVEYLSAEKLLDKEKEMLELAIESIEEMSNKLIEKYKVSKDEEAEA